MTERPRSVSTSAPDPLRRADGRRVRGEKSRAAVLSRAIQVASADGLNGLTIGRLATDVGVAKANITVLFGDKVSLQLATLDAATALFVEEVVKPAREEVSPIVRLAKLTDGWFSYVERRVLAGGCLMHGSSSEYRARPGLIQDRVRSGRDAWLNLLVQTLAAAAQAGELKPATDIEQSAFELFAYEAAANVASLIGDQQTFQRARRTTQDLIEGVTATSQQPKNPAGARHPRRKAPD